MKALAVVDNGADWRRLKALVLDSVSSPITKRVYNHGLDEFFAWYSQEPRPGFTKATVAAWRVALEAGGLGAVSIKVRITAVRKLAVEAADNGLPARSWPTGTHGSRASPPRARGSATGSPRSRPKRSSTRRTPSPTRACGTGPFSRPKRDCALLRRQGKHHDLLFDISDRFSAGTPALKLRLLPTNSLPDEISPLATPPQTCFSPSNSDLHTSPQPFKTHNVESPNGSLQVALLKAPRLRDFSTLPKPASAGAFPIQP